MSDSFAPASTTLSDTAHPRLVTGSLGMNERNLGCQHATPNTPTAIQSLSLQPYFSPDPCLPSLTHPWLWSVSPLCVWFSVVLLIVTLPSTSSTFVGIQWGVNPVSWQPIPQKRLLWHLRDSRREGGREGDRQECNRERLSRLRQKREL